MTWRTSLPREARQRLSQSGMQGEGSSCFQDSSRHGPFFTELGEKRMESPVGSSEAVVGPQMFATQVIMSLHIDHITSASKASWALTGGRQLCPRLQTGDSHYMPTSALMKASDLPARPTPSVHLHAIPPSPCLCGSPAHPPHRPVPKRAPNARRHHCHSLLASQVAPGLAVRLVWAHPRRCLWPFTSKELGLQTWSCRTKTKKEVAGCRA